MNFKECCVNANANASPLLDTATVHAKVAVNVIVDVEVNAIVNVNDHISVDVDLNAKVDADADVYAVGITLDPFDTQHRCFCPFLNLNETPCLDIYYETN